MVLTSFTNIHKIEEVQDLLKHPVYQLIIESLMNNGFITHSLTKSLYNNNNTHNALKRLLKLNIIKSCRLKGDDKTRFLSQEGIGEYHYNKATFYKLTTKIKELFNKINLKSLIKKKITDKVRLKLNKFRDYINKINKIKQDKKQKLNILNEMPNNLKLYFKNKSNWSEKRLKKTKKILMKNNHYMKFLKENGLVL